jgi:hypothetical protein
LIQELITRSGILTGKSTSGDWEPDELEEKEQNERESGFRFLLLLIHLVTDPSALYTDAGLQGQLGQTSRHAGPYSIAQREKYQPT